MKITYTKYNLNQLFNKWFRIIKQKYFLSFFNFTCVDSYFHIWRQSWFFWIADIFFFLEIKNFITGPNIKLIIAYNFNDCRLLRYLRIWCNTTLILKLFGHFFGRRLDFIYIFEPIYFIGEGHLVHFFGVSQKVVE